jgi:iron complex outermembrane receptor protein
MWRQCLPTLTFLPELGDLWLSNPAYVKAIIAGKKPSGGSPKDNLLAVYAISAINKLGPSAMIPNCGDANQDFEESRGDVEIQDTITILNQLRMVSGGGYRRDRAISQTYLKGLAYNDTWKAFANIEYKPWKNTNINVGAFYEKQTMNGFSFSPRLAMNIGVDANNTLRFILSRAKRTPNIVENSLNWSYLATNLEKPINGKSSAYYAPTVVAKGVVTAETNLSKEIGYNGNFPNYGIVLDAKIFENNLTNLISERFQIANFKQSNNNSVKLSGAELQLNYKNTNNFSLYGGYTYLINNTLDTQEQSQYAKHSGFIAATHTFEGDLVASVSISRSLSPPGLNNGSDKQELNFSKSFHLEKNITITPSLTATHINQKNVVYFSDIGKVNSNIIGSTMQYNFNFRLVY